MSPRIFRSRARCCGCFRRHTLFLRGCELQSPSAATPSGMENKPYLVGPFCRTELDSNLASRATVLSDSASHASDAHGALHVDQNTLGRNRSSGERADSSALKALGGGINEGAATLQFPDFLRRMG